MGTNEKPKNRRRFYRLLLSPWMQLKYGAYYGLIAIFSLLFWNALVIYFLIELIHTSSNSDPATTIAQNLLTTLKQNRDVFILGLTILGALFMSFSVVLTKNIVGPMNALLKHVQALKNGQYEFKTTLRKYDELKPLMIALNELSDNLRDRHQQKYTEEHRKQA